MPRTPGSLKPEAVEPVLAYLKAASLRSSDVFRPGASATTRLAVLDRELTSTKPEYRHQALGEWVVRHLTPAGRTRMLATLRRRKADATAPRARYTLRLRGEDAVELQELSKRLAMPATLLVRALAAIAAADDELRKQVIRLAVATKLGERKGLTTK